MIPPWKICTLALGSSATLYGSTENRPGNIMLKPQRIMWTQKRYKLSKLDCLVLTHNSPVPCDKDESAVTFLLRDVTSQLDTSLWDEVHVRTIFREPLNSSSFVRWQCTTGNLVPGRLPNGRYSTRCVLCAF